MKPKGVQEFLNNEDKYRQLLDRITDGFIALDKNFCYTYANQKIGEFLKRDAAGLIGKNIWEEFPDVVGSYTYRAFQTAMKEQRFISNIDYYEPLGLWQENYIYPSPDGLSVFIKDITGQKALEQNLKDQERKQQLQIIATTLEAQEKERTYIARELHDNVNQLLTATKLTLALAKDDPLHSTSLIDRCLIMLDKAVQESRKLTHELITPAFIDENFIEEVSILIESMLSTKGIRATIDSSGFDEKLLSEEMKLAVYRIAQEQCTNIVRYAEAKTVSIHLEATTDIFTMTIADDGKGMDIHHYVKGIGFRNIEGRLQLFEGTMQILSSPGEGFKLKIYIPLVLSNK